MTSLTNQNQYTSITNYYDLLMTQGYYDYQTMAQAVNSLIKAKDYHKIRIYRGRYHGINAGNCESKIGRMGEINRC